MSALGVTSINRGEATEILAELASHVSVKGDSLCIDAPHQSAPCCQLDRSAAADPQPRWCLARFLYAHWYAYDASMWSRYDVDPLIGIGARLADPEFVDLLHHANPAPGYGSGGWTLVGREAADRFLVERDGVRLAVSKQYHVLDQNAEPALGDAITVRFPPGSTTAAPGFYVAFGAEGPSQARERTRFYLNLAAETAPRRSTPSSLTSTATGLPLV